MLAISLSQDFNESQINNIQEALYHKGLLVQVKSNFRLMRFYPPLIINKEEIDYLIDSLKKILIDYL